MNLPLYKQALWIVVSLSLSKAIPLAAMYALSPAISSDCICP